MKTETKRARDFCHVPALIRHNNEESADDVCVKEAFDEYLQRDGS